MAIGKVRYTQDTRFTPLHEEGNDVWALKIQETRMSDSGLYECQVSYHDDVEKKLKMPVRLIVLGKGTSKEIKMIIRLFLVIAIYCQGSSSQIKSITQPLPLLAGWEGSLCICIDVCTSACAKPIPKIVPMVKLDRLPLKNGQFCINI